MTRLMKGDKFRGLIGDEIADAVIGDPLFNDVVEYTVQMAWVHAHQDDYELTEDEKKQDFVEFQQDMGWRCESEVATGGGYD